MRPAAGADGPKRKESLNSASYCCCYLLGARVDSLRQAAHFRPFLLFSSYPVPLVSSKGCSLLFSPFTRARLYFSRGISLLSRDAFSTCPLLFLASFSFSVCVCVRVTAENKRSEHEPVQRILPRCLQSRSAPKRDVQFSFPACRVMNFISMHTLCSPLCCV